MGTAEIFEEDDIVAQKVEKLVDLILKSKYIVVHTGAGISTSSGIPDFRGPSGVCECFRLKESFNALST